MSNLIINILAVALSILSLFVAIIFFRNKVIKIKNKKNDVFRYYKNVLSADLDAGDLSHIRDEISLTLTKIIKMINILKPELGASASVKILSSKGESVSDLYVLTLARDGIAGVNREVFKDEYPVAQNSLFRESMEDTSKDYLFLSDIKRASDAIYYNKKNADWNVDYKSVFVFPIYFYKKESEKKVTGFLCIDTKKPVEEGSPIYHDIIDTSLATLKYITSLLSDLYIKKLIDQKLKDLETSVSKKLYTQGS